jgi:hypothetical protein
VGVIATCELTKVPFRVVETEAAKWNDGEEVNADEELDSGSVRPLGFQSRDLGIFKGSWTLCFLTLAERLTKDRHGRARLFVDRRRKFFNP